MQKIKLSCNTAKHSSDCISLPSSDSDWHGFEVYMSKDNSQISLTDQAFAIFMPANPFCRVLRKHKELQESSGFCPEVMHSRGSGPSGAEVAWTS